MTTETFARLAPLDKDVEALIARDRYGRPLIFTLGPDGKPTDRTEAYTRASTIGGALEDTYHLGLWQQQQVMVGAAKAPSLLLETEHLGPRPAKSDEKAYKTWKEAMNDIVQRAHAAAGSSDRASWGTFMHTVFEAADAGQPWPAIPEPFRGAISPASMARDVAARATETAGWRWLGREIFVVNDEWKVAGTVDGLALVPHPTKPGHWLIRCIDDKGLALDTKLPTPTGWTTMGAVEVGDEVIDAAGQPCTVVRKSEVKRIGTYIVRFDDNSMIVCDTEHLWWTAAGRPDGDLTLRVRPVQEIIDTLRLPNGNSQHRIPVAGALDLPDADLPIDPYLLGCWLGDGTKSTTAITKQDDLFDILLADGHALGVRQAYASSTKAVTRCVLGLRAKLDALNLLSNKHIPDVYLRASISQRLLLLQGLMDTDGHWNHARKRVSFDNTSKELTLAVHELITSLGQRASLTQRQATGFGKTVTAYRVEFRPVDINPFRLPRKANPCAASTASTTRAMRRVIVAIEPGPDVETACIAVDSPTHTYLCGENMIPTHNSGESVDFSTLKFAVQVAAYIGAAIYDPRTGVRTPFISLLPPDIDPATVSVDLTKAVILHTPVGEGRCDKQEVPLAKAFAALALAADVRATRTASNKWLKLAGRTQMPPLADADLPAAALAASTPVSTTEPVDRISDEIAAAGSIEELLAIREKGSVVQTSNSGKPWTAWTAQHEELAAARAAVLNTAAQVDPVLAAIVKAQSTDDLLIIWKSVAEYGHDGGVWTPEYAAAADVRVVQIALERATEREPVLAHIAAATSIDDLNNVWHSVADFGGVWSAEYSAAADAKAAEITGGAA